MNFTVGIIAAVGILVAISLVMIAIDPGYLSGIPVKPVEEPIACTKEYVPVCGVDGVTYGNKCTLDAAKINLDYSGECVTIKPLQEGWKQMKSEQDPGVGHESHQIAMLLPLGDTVYSGTLQYDATEPVQLITLRGPLGPEDKPSATWTPDGITLYALNLVDPGNSTGTWEFTGNALAVHTRNTAQFTVNYFITETNATEQEIPHAGTPTAPVTFTVSIPPGVSSPGCEVTKECYLLDSIEIRVHDTVIWSNDDTAAHTVTSGSTSGVDGTFDSGLFMAGSTFSYTFDEAGTYPYFCMVHPWMTGEVVVKEINDMMFNPNVGVEISSETATVPEPVPAPVPEPVPAPVVTPEVEEKRAAPLEVKMAQGAGVPGCEETQECYLPYKAEIYSGEPIVWNNADSAAHTVTSGIPGTPDGTFDSGMIMSGQTWQFVFTDPGEYDYYCLIHPWMTGKVIVS